MHTLLLIWACAKNSPDTDSGSPPTGTNLPQDSSDTEESADSRTGPFDTSGPCATDCDGDGYTTEDGDCDDDDDSVHPEADETPYDGIDQDCDGSDLLDVDGDGWTHDLDCDDEDGAIHPDQTEDGFNEVDDDCDGYVDLDGRSEWDSDVVWLGEDGGFEGANLGEWPFTFTEDYDGDGIADIAAPAIHTAYLLPGAGTVSASASDDAFATFVRDESEAGPWGALEFADAHSVPDIDGDGLSDVLLSLDGDADICGVGIWGSRRFTSGATLLGEDVDVALLSSHSTKRTRPASGDLDGDGLAELFLGESWHNSHDGNEGRVVIIRPDDLTAGLAVSLDDIGQHLVPDDPVLFGDKIWTIGDVDGDGYQSLAVRDGAGIWLIDGDSLTGVSDVPESEWDMAFVEGMDNSEGILTPGDIDDDGLDDVLMLIDRQLEVFLDLGTGGIRNLSASSASVYISTEGESLEQVTGPVRLRDGNVDVVVSTENAEKDLYFIGLEELPIKGELDLAGWPHGIGGPGTNLCAIGSSSDFPTLLHGDLDDDGDDEIACGNYSLTAELATGTTNYGSGQYPGGIISIFYNPL